MGAADGFFKKADEALKKKNGTDYAIQLFQEGLKIDPDRLEERKKLRAAAIKRCLESGKDTQGGTTLKMKFAFALTNIKKLSMQKKWEEQIVALEVYLAEAPENVDANMTLARAYEATSRRPSAIWSYGIVIGKDPRNVEAWRALGKLHDQDGDRERAIQCWERVKEYRPEDQEAGKAIRDLSAATMMDRAEKRRAEGKGGFRDLLKDEVESEKLQKKAAHIRTEDDATTAIMLKQEEVAAQPDNPRLWRELGDIYLKHKKDFEEARRCYERSKAIDPHDLLAADRLAKLGGELLKHELDTLRKRVQDSPNDGALVAELATKTVEQREYAIADAKREVEAHPTDYGIKFKYGRLLMDEKRYDDAIAQFQQARKDPKFAIASHHMTGKCWLAKKLYDLAIRELSSAIAGISEKDSDSGKEARYDLGHAYLAKNEVAKADEIFQEIMSLDIGYRDVVAIVTKIHQGSA